MSGGHWNYQGDNLRHGGMLSAGGLELLAEIEQLLDRGICGDDGIVLAERRAIAKLYAFFEGLWGSEELAARFQAYSLSPTDLRLAVWEEVSH